MGLLVVRLGLLILLVGGAVWLYRRWVSEQAAKLDEPEHKDSRDRDGDTQKSDKDDSDFKD